MPKIWTHYFGMMSDFAKKVGKPTDAVADEINEIAVELIGDILLEDRDGTFFIVEDYNDFVESMKENENEQ